MAKKSSESSQHAKRTKMSKKNIGKITPKTLTELNRLAKNPDEKIDYSDIPPLDFKHLGKAGVGQFYRPLKKQISIRLDMDILEWFKRSGNKYQTLINKACREYIEKHGK